MSRRSPRAAEALANLIDDLAAAAMEAPDADLVAEIQGAWIKGYAAGQVRAVLSAALRGVRMADVPPQPAIPGADSVRWLTRIRLPAEPRPEAGTAPDRWRPAGARGPTLRRGRDC